MDTKYYELHVTVLPQQVIDFALFCKNIQAKPLYIQLDRGIHKNQLMLAATNMLPDDTAARAWAEDYRLTVHQHFEVTRTKLESRLTEGPNEYYEAHWKLDFPYGDWSAPYRSPAGLAMVLSEWGERFDLVIGRRTYDQFSSFWPNSPLK